MISLDIAQNPFVIDLFVGSAIIINSIVAFNNRKFIFSGCKCSYSDSWIHSIIIFIFAFLMSAGVVFVFGCISVTLGKILFFGYDPLVKQSYINLTMMISILLSMSFLPSLLSFVNKKGINIALRFLKLHKTKDK